MSDGIWPRVSKSHPCPICGKEDWCQIGDRAVKCMRVESTHACASGGWYHFTAPKNVTFTKPPPRIASREIDAAGFMKIFRAETQLFQFNSFAQSLGVLPEAIIGIGAAFSKTNNAWAFPMRDGDGKTIGIRLRNLEGHKWAIKGSRQGIFIPDGVVTPQPVAYLPEGPTDTAALLSLGLYAIGRPTCMSGNEQIKAALKRLGIFRVVIVADNDEMKKVAGKDTRPGISGALKLKAELGLNSVIWVPPTPCKDVREFVRRGGSKALIESDIRSKIWSKK